MILSTARPGAHFVLSPRGCQRRTPSTYSRQWTVRTMNLSTGFLTPIGRVSPWDRGVSTPRREICSHSASMGNLQLDQPDYRVLSHIGATGLGDCSVPTSPCAQTPQTSSASRLKPVCHRPRQQPLLSRPATGAATLIGATGIPGVPFTPHAPVPGTLTALSTSMTSPLRLRRQPLPPTSIPASSIHNLHPTPLIAPELYKIDTTTGLANLHQPTAQARRHRQRQWHALRLRSSPPRWSP